ncbi:MAG: glycosyltransferase family 2 protein [Solirubrobacteraceae bacterium]|nr:glycosyltransferase family 2 protein [Solirubrobacteraceae bacterium]
MNSLSIAVVIPSFNHERSIERCLQSVLDQRETNWTCIVVDDCSSDRTVEIATRIAKVDDRVSVVVNERNLGLVGNHNRCLEVAHGDLVKFVHADDWLLPDCLDKLAGCFVDPAVTFALGGRRVEGGEDWEFGRLNDPLDWSRGSIDGAALLNEYVSRGGYGNWFGEPSAVMFRSQTVETVGGFSGLLTQALDTELWLRLIGAGAAARVADELSVRVHSLGTATERNRKGRTYWLDGVWVLLALSWNEVLPVPVRLRAKVYAARALRRALIEDWRGLRVEDRRAQLRDLMLPGRKTRFRRSLVLTRNGVHAGR